MPDDALQSLYTQAGDEFTVLLWGLAKLVVLAMLLERALFFFFDYSKWRDKLSEAGGRAPIALVVSVVICAYYDFDVMYLLLDPRAGPSALGIALTASVVAGGSAAAIQLFQNVFKFSREAREAGTNRQAAERDKAAEEAAKAKESAEQAKAKALEAQLRVKELGAQLKGGSV